MQRSCFLILCGFVVIFANDSLATRWCSRGESNACLFVDVATEDLVDVFNATYNVRSISFDWSVIRNFPTAIKTTSRFSNVISIDLACLGIKTAPKIKFDFIESLDVLEMGTNKIEVLPSNMFEFVPTITSLNLERNQIKTIHPNAFNGLKNLQTLMLGYNQIREIDSKMFLPFQQLDVLNFYGNRLQDIENVEFPKELREIVIAYNSVSKGISKLLDLKNLTTINIHQICYKSVNANCCDERSSVLDTLTNRGVVVFEKPWLDDCYNPIAD